MCTLTAYPVLREQRVSDLIITMNRDEALARPEARPITSEHYWHTVDAKAGGSWFGARFDNPDGLHNRGWAFALLNRYQDAAINSPVAPNSRGDIIPKLLKAASFKLAWQSMAKLDCTQFAPFDLIAFALVDGKALACQWQWSGRALSHQQKVLTQSDIWVSSSVDIDEANEVRRSTFAQFAEHDWSRQSAGTLTQELTALHLTSYAANPSLGFAMRRPGRATRSLSQVSLSQTGSVSCRYLPVMTQPLAGSIG